MLLSSSTQDPNTQVGKVIVTSTSSLWELDFKSDASQPSSWTISNATKLAGGLSYYPGGYVFIPSGKFKNNIFFCDWSYDKVKMMSFEPGGVPVLNPPGDVNSPVIQDFINDVTGPWGLVSAAHYFCKISSYYHDSLTASSAVFRQTDE